VTEGAGEAQAETRARRALELLLLFLVPSAPSHFLAVSPGILSVGRELGALGFTSPDALFSRLAPILFRPTPPLLAALRPFAQPDNADEPPPVTLAIQVRLGATGGGARGQVGLGLGELPRFRAAADRISQRVSRSDPYRSVAWVLAADSLKVVETVFREEWNGGHVRWHNHSSSLALALARSSAAAASSSTPRGELERGSVEDSGEGHVLLGSLIDFFALALSDHALVSVPSTFGFTARLFNLTGSTVLHAILRQGVLCDARHKTPVVTGCESGYKQTPIPRRVIASLSL